MRGLRICLWISGVFCLLSILGVILPVSAFEAIVRPLGDIAIPTGPVFLYLLRVVCATFALIGIYFIMLAMDPMRYGVLVPFSGLAGVLIGVICLVAGASTGMPMLWYMGDGLPCVILGVLIYLFWQKARSLAA